MENFDLMAGSALPISVGLLDGRDQPITIYASTTPIDAVLWPGGNRAVSFPVAAQWGDASQGLIQLNIYGIQSAQLASGRYYGELTVHDPQYGPLVAYQWTVDIRDAPGAAVAGPVYCEPDDLALFARSWLPNLESDDDIAGFARQRERARAWLDDLILSRYPSQTFTMIGSPGYGSFEWGSGYATPNPWLRGQLDNNALVVRQWVVECTANKTLALICRGQIGPGEGDQDFQRLGRFYENEANRIALSNVAEIAGVGGQTLFSINLGGGSVR